jgi:FkbH-like protein
MVKLVIFDLDDTLWRGQIAEHYGQGVSWPRHDGWPAGLWEAVQHLRARGIITAICSKNEESLVRDRWSHSVRDPWITLDDFALREINWRPKAENVGLIIEQTSVTPKSVIFVDDNPVERAAVKAAFPDIRVIGGNPYETRRLLLWSPETQIAVRTAESGVRENSIRQMQVREQARTSMSREDFLASLDCKIELIKIAFSDHKDFARVYELLNKTNQFNTTGKRWTNGQVFGFFKLGGVIYAFRVKDRFTDYGLVGVVLFLHGDFVQLAMSCRVLGLGVETSVISYIMLEAATPSFTAKVIETEANIVCRDVFARTGFNDDGDGRYSFVGEACRRRIASHLTIVADYSVAR